VQKRSVKVRHFHSQIVITMLADQRYDVNSKDDITELFPLKRKKSVLKKTMKALGSVKTKIKKKSKKSQMERFDSDSSAEEEDDMQNCEEHDNDAFYADFGQVEDLHVDIDTDGGKPPSRSSSSEAD